MSTRQRRRPRAVTDEVARRLRDEPLETVGRITTASNATFLARLGDSGDMAIYKPARGEAPLWDFPGASLYRREVAAFEVDRLLGWNMVPPTVARDEGPLGRGSVQLFIDHDPERHYFALIEEDDDHVRAQLQRMVVFDLVVNNADRKASHVLAEDGHDSEPENVRLWLVDHGVCFHDEDKLRTVAWDFAGVPIPAALRDDADRLATRLGQSDELAATALPGLLDQTEIDALARRARRVGQRSAFPHPRGRRPYPWPPL